MQLNTDTFLIQSLFKVDIERYRLALQRHHANDLHRLARTVVCPLFIAVAIDILYFVQQQANTQTLTDETKPRTCRDKLLLALVFVISKLITIEKRLVGPNPSDSNSDSNAAQPSV